MLNHQKNIINQLTNRNDITIMKQDKTGGLVIMNRGNIQRKVC